MAIILAGWLLSLAVAGSAFAGVCTVTLPGYTCTSFDVPGASSTLAYGINDGGQIAGVYQNAARNDGFLRNVGGGITSLVISGATSIRALGINDTGQIVGIYSDSTVNDDGFLRDVGGGITHLAISGSGSTRAFGINNVGQIVGAYSDSAGKNHGFLRDAGGGFTSFDAAGALGMSVFGINNVGQIVGAYSDATALHGFLRDAGGGITSLDVAGASATILHGINDAGQIVGFYQNATALHGFLRDAGGGITSLDVAGASATFAHGINDTGQIVGGYTDSTGTHGFLATPSITLIDPVPQLLSGPRITNALTAAQGFPYLADFTKGTVVKGVATDGVAQVVLRISAKSVGEQFALTVRADQCAGLSSNACIDEYGLLFDPGNPPANIFTNTQGQSLLVTAVSTDNGPMAFAAYRAPVDFVRSGIPSGADSLVGDRSAFISINSTQSGAQPDLNIKLVRPLVVLVHGFWGSSKDWNNFSLNAPSETQFEVGRVNYDIRVPITSSDPGYRQYILDKTSGNMLGFAYNAGSVLDSVKVKISNFKVKSSVASVQADIVAHSMGGLVTRQMALRADFYSSRDYNAGSVHKLITIGTPFLGSRLPIEVLKSNNVCSRGVIAAGGGKVAFESVGLVGSTVTGGAGDLKGDGTGGLLSIALTVQKQSPPRLYTAMIIGEMTSGQLAALDNSHEAGAIREWCRADPLAINLTSAGWPTIVGQRSDAVVSVNSQVNGHPDLGGTPLPAIHSEGMTMLGFQGPPEQDIASTNVIKLLNTSLMDSSVFIKQ